MTLHANASITFTTFAMHKCIFSNSHSAAYYFLASTRLQNFIRLLNSEKRLFYSLEHSVLSSSFLHLAIFVRPVVASVFKFDPPSFLMKFSLDVLLNLGLIHNVGIPRTKFQNSRSSGLGNLKNVQIWPKFCVMPALSHCF